MERISIEELRAIGCQGPLDVLVRFAWWLANHGVCTPSQIAAQQDLSQFEGLSSLSSVLAVAGLRSFFDRRVVGAAAPSDGGQRLRAYS